MKKTINNTLTALVALLAMAFSACSQNDNGSAAVLDPVVGQWEGTGEEGWLYYEDGKTVEIHYLYKDNMLYSWYYDENGDLEEKEVEKEAYEPSLLNIMPDGIVTLISRESEMEVPYYLEGNQIVMPIWGDEKIWYYSVEDPKMVLEELNYYKGLLKSRIVTPYERK